jgi:hypothetical protein
MIGASNDSSIDCHCAFAQQFVGCASHLPDGLGLLLTLGGFFGFLPLVGFWMLPLGLALLADDVPLLRSLRSRILDWVEHRHRDWIDDGARR